MRKTRWARKFAGRDLLAIAAFYRKLGKEEGSLLLVWQSVYRVLERCQASVVAWHHDEEDGDVVLGWLSSPQTDKHNPEPFSTYYDPMLTPLPLFEWQLLLCSRTTLFCGSIRGSVGDLLLGLTGWLALNRRPGGLVWWRRLRLGG